MEAGLLLATLISKVYPLVVAILVFMEAGLLQQSQIFVAGLNSQVAILVFMEAGLLPYSDIANVLKILRRNPSFHGSGFTTMKYLRQPTRAFMVAILVFMEAGLLRLKAQVL